MIIQTARPLRKRDPLDHYPTPLDVCRAGVGLLPEWAGQCPRILDPGAGTGVWGHAARERWPFAQIYGLELNKRQAVSYPDAYTRYDYGNFLTARRESDVAFDLVIGNPPYKFALEFIEKSLDWLCAGGSLLFLLRLAFLESQERYPFFCRCPPRRVWVLSRRPSFTGDGQTDATAYALYLWQAGWQGKTGLDWLLWRNSNSGEYHTGQMRLEL
jgi:hypothetical protein